MTEEATEQSRNKALIQDSFERWRSGAGSPFDLLHPDAEWTIIGSSPLSGTYRKAEFFEKVVIPFNGLLKTPAVPTVLGVYADGDMVIVRFDAEATARDGSPYRNNYAWFLKIEDGLIVIDVKKHAVMRVAFDAVADAKLLMTDALLAATAPLSTEGADEFEETASDDADLEGQD